MRQLIFLFFLFPLIAVGQQSPTQILNTPWQKINYKLEVGQRLLLPADTLSYPPGATVRDTTRLLAFAANGNLYKLWNGVWSLIGAGGGTDVQLLGDTAIVVGDDTVRIKPITFESDMPPAYFFKDGDTIRDYTLQYLNDSVKVRKSGDTLFFPNGDTVLLGAAGIPDATKTNRGLVNISTQQFAGLKQFTSGISIGDSSSDGSRVATWFNRFGGGRIAGTIRGSSVVTDNYWDFQPGNVGAIGRLLSPGGAEVLTWQDSVFAGIITAARYNVSWQDSSFAPFVGKIYGKADGKIYYLNGKGQDYDLTGGGGSGTVTTGYGIIGDGSGGNPLRVDSATLRGDYIRNQYAAKENKSAWVQRLRADSIHAKNYRSDSGFIFQPQLNTIDTIGNGDMILAANTTQPNRILRAGALRAIIGGYDNSNSANLASSIISSHHSAIEFPVDHSVVFGGSYDTIKEGSKSAIHTSQFFTLSGAFSMATGVLNGSINGNYSHTYGGTGIYSVGDYITTIGGRDKTYKSSYGGGIGGQNIDFDNTYTTDYSVNLGGFDLSMGVSRNSRYSGVGGRNNSVSGDYSFVWGRDITTNGNNTVALGYNADVAHSGSFSFADGSGTGVTSTSIYQFNAFFTNGYRLLGGNVGIGVTSMTSKIDVSATNGYQQLRLRTSYTPTSSADTNGNTGDTAWDDNYFYIKTSAGWKRAALSTF